MSSPSMPALLEVLRNEIDAIDAELVALIRRRQHCATRVGETKRSSGAPALRPLRERAVVDRVTALGGDLPVDLIEGVWRRLIGASLTAQAPLTLAVHARAHPIAVSAAAAARFAAPVTSAPDAAAALAAARADQAIAIVELTPGDDWWTSLGGSGLTAFDILRCAEGRAVALAVARLDDSDARSAVTLVPEAAFPARLHGGEPLQPIAHGGDYWLCVA